MSVLSRVFLSFFVFALVAIFFSVIVSAAPAPWGIALNEEKEHCAGYWFGDEYKQNPLPEGWVAYYPEINGEGKFVINTPIGTCSWKYESASSCCRELAYSFVSENIGAGTYTTGDEVQEKIDLVEEITKDLFTRENILLAGGVCLFIALGISVLVVLRKQRSL